MEFEVKRAIKGEYNFDEICESLSRELTSLKAEDKSAEADQVWRQLQIFSIWQRYLTIYNMIKEQRYYEAWCLIEQVLISNYFLLNNFPEDRKNTDFI